MSCGVGDERKKVEIFWTGGFDSTYRIAELSRYNLIIQPYYMSDNRKSENYELNAMKEITELLNCNSNTKAEILSPIVIDPSERIEDPVITEAYQRILETDFFGSQYDWLARFAKIHPGIELSIHKDDKATAVIQKYGATTSMLDDWGGVNNILDIEDSTEDVIILFSNYHLPLINTTKLEMKQWFIDNGYQNIMNKTWFCYSPIKGKPCGICNPCRYTIEEGMTERFSKSALIRYRLYPIHNSFAVRKFRSLYKRLFKNQ